MDVTIDNPTDDPPEKLVSVIISSYNYEDYIAQAIDSALNLDWPAVEVIVVDDGSKDNSRKIIDQYGDRITKIYQENRGRVYACNVGFSRSKGDIIIFLDSDDVLDPKLLRETVPHFGAHTSKVQCQMQRIDQDGQWFGSPMPSFAVNPDPTKIRKWYFNTGSYPTPQGSGNLYARSFLKDIFPLDHTSWDSTDSCCLAASPLYGDIETVKQALVYYRVHGRNASISKNFNPDIERKELLRSIQRHNYAVQIAKNKNIDFKELSIFKSIHFATHRLVTYKSLPEQHPIVAESTPKILFSGVKALLNPQGYNQKSLLLLIVWYICTCISPNFLARRLITWKKDPNLRIFSRLRSYRDVKNLVFSGRNH